MWEEKYFLALKDSIIGSVILAAGTSLVSHRVLNRCDCFCVGGQKSRISLQCAEGKLQLFISRLLLVPMPYSVPDKGHLTETGVHNYLDLNIHGSVFSSSSGSIFVYFFRFILFTYLLASLLLRSFIYSFLLFSPILILFLPLLLWSAGSETVLENKHTYFYVKWNSVRIFDY